MNALILDASPTSDHPAARAAEALEDAFRVRGAAVSRVRIADLDLAPCNGCFGCWTTRPGECLIGDDARGLAARVVAADAVAVAGPVEFGAWGSLAKNALDRLICLILPHFTTVDGEVHHERRYPRYPRWIALGTLPAPNQRAEAIFRRVIDRNAVNLHNPAHATGVLVGEADAGPLAGDLVAKIGEVA
jgi:hypothetical protein